MCVHDLEINKAYLAIAEHAPYSAFCSGEVGTLPSSVSQTDTMVLSTEGEETWSSGQLENVMSVPTLSSFVNQN